MKKIEINGKTYDAAEIDFNAMCDLEEMGISLFEADNKGLSSLRAYLALSMGATTREAGAEIGEHIANGGNLDDLNKAFSEAVKESVFFKKTPKEAKA